MDMEIPTTIIIDTRPVQEAATLPREADATALPHPLAVATDLTKSTLPHTLVDTTTILANTTRSIGETTSKMITTTVNTDLASWLKTEGLTIKRLAHQDTELSPREAEAGADRILEAVVCNSKRELIKELVPD